MDSSPVSPFRTELGSRLAALEPRLRLLCTFLASPALRARVPVEDLVQEVYLRALAAAGSLPPAEPGEAPLARYLGRLARNAVVDAVRAQRAQRRAGRDQPLTLADWSRTGAGASRCADRGPGPATQAAGREVAARLQAAFEGLSPEHRRVIGLRQLEGLSAEESGRRMGRSAAAVHSLYRRALAAWEEAVR